MNFNPLDASRSIGALLIDSGRLSVDNVERILQVQREKGQRFGETAIALGLLSMDDILYALARQYHYPYLQPTEDHVSDELIAAFKPLSHQVEALRALRSQLMVRWFTGGHERRTLVVASPGRGDGRSYLAANLSVVFSQLGEHTLLIDADMRNPRQHKLFNLENRSGLSSILSHRGSDNEVKRIPSFMDLSVLSAGPVPPNPQELLGRHTFAKLLEEKSQEFDVIIIDTPAAVECSDVQTIAVRASGALLLARVKETSVAAFRELATTLSNSGVAVVGSVLNESLVNVTPR